MRLATTGLLLALTLVAFAARSLILDAVFAGDRVLLEPFDAAYHARRAFYTFEDFPRLLLFDPYLAFPEGAAVPVPPLYDWALGAAARVAGRSPGTFDQVAAWSSPVLGAASVPLVFAAGRLLGGVGVGLGAASIFALLPVSITFSSVGNCDHHAFVALLYAAFLACGLALLRPSVGRGERAALAAVLAALRACVVLSWTGSLLYLGVADGSLLLAAVLGGRREVLVAQAWGALVAAAPVALWLLWVGTPFGGPFSGPLSWLQVSLLLGTAWTAGGMAVAEALRPAAGATGRVARVAGLGAVALLVLLAVPSVRAALTPLLQLGAKADVWAPRNAEQRALFGSGLPGKSPAELYGLFAYLIPLAVLAPLLRVREPRWRDRAVFAAAWSATLGALAIQQVRFGNDFAPAASLCFAFGLRELARRLPDRLPRGARACVAVLAGGLLMGPAIANEAVRVPIALASLRGEEHLLPTPRQSLYQFAAEIRDNTPETSGYADPDRRPEYSVLCLPGFGHVMIYAAHRPTPAGNMGPYLDEGKFEAANAFFRARSEEEGLALVRRLGARYVLTAANAGLRPPHLDYRLHREDGSARDGRSQISHFRLITEGPKDGRPIRQMYPRLEPRRLVVYKLFQVVEGAVLEVRAAPGAEVQAELLLETPIGRRFVYRALGRAGADGVARIPVAYATEPLHPVRAVGSYRVRAGGREVAVRVAEADVLEGRAVAVSGQAASPSLGS
jgi:asparagine N-glycosylation enzyme membrane subunit Stt3